jgi:lysophospholipase L1-like esterase
MTRITRITRVAATLALASLVSVPLFAARGSANFTRFVVLGDSYGAGVSNNSLNERHQPFSWPAVVAMQTGAPEWVQPLVSYPGIGPELVLLDVTTLPPRIVTAPGQGTPLNLTFGRPYNNLAIPGAAVGHLITLTGAEQNPQGTAALFAQFILRGQGTAVQQALAQNPTFIAVWIGGNDLLAGVLTGRPALMTPLETFRNAYNSMISQLANGAPQAGIVVGNLPTNALSVPLLSTVPPFIINPATGQPVPGPTGQPIFLIADLGQGRGVGQLEPGSAVLLTSAAKLATGFGIPPTLRNIPPFNQLPNAGTPLADEDVLTPQELQAIAARAAEYNTVIQQAASGFDIPVVDINGLFNRFAAGMNVGPFRFTSSYIQGGIFSYDGFHLTDIGYTFFANEYIRTINQAYQTQIPVASISRFMENNGAFFPDDRARFEMTDEAAKAILKFFTPPPAKRRLRASTH